MSNAAGAVSLKVLAERKVEGIGKSTNFNVDPRLIKIQPGFNARPIDPEHVASLKLAHQSGAVFPPLFVRVANGEIILIEGHHRLTAIMGRIVDGEDIKSVACIEFKGTDAERILLMVNSASNKPLTPLQAGTQYRLLLNMGWSGQDIANKVGKSITHVNQAIELASSNSDVQTMVTNNEVAAHVALAAVKEHGEKAGTVLGEALVKAKASGKTKVTAKTVKKEAPKVWPFPNIADPSKAPGLGNRGSGQEQYAKATAKESDIQAAIDKTHNNAARYVFMRDKMTPDQIIQWAMGGKKDAMIDKVMK